jgi:hypothetical protein
LPVGAYEPPGQQVADRGAICIVSQHLYPARAQYCKRPKVPHRVAPGSPSVLLAIWIQQSRMRCNTYSLASLDQTRASLERRENFRELELRGRLDSSRGVGWFWGPFCRSVPGKDERCEREATDRSTRLMLYSSSAQHVSVDTGGVFYSEVCVVSCGVCNFRQSSALSGLPAGTTRRS